MANRVEFRDVVKRFGDVRAVNGVSFSIGGGEVVALLGPSGCGKTTVLRCLAGFERPDAGSIAIDGVDVTGLRPYERNIGLLFQHYALFPHMTVAQNIAYGLRYRGARKSDIPARVAEMLELVRLRGFDDRRPHELSGGQQQRVALARALATRPGLMLLDEPLSALDAKLRQDLRHELKELLALVGSTAIVVTHDQEEAMSLGERVLVMNEGKIVQSGPPEDVYRRPVSRFVADFMGRVNWLHGKIETGADGLGRFTNEEGLALTAAIPDAWNGGAAYLCIRPECIDIAPAEGGAPDGVNRLECRVLDVAPLGAVRQIVVGALGGARLVIVQQNRPQPAIAKGAAVTVAFSAEACVIVPSGPLGAG